VKATIHQPDFLPWPGLFNKISHCETWIVLDHVENNPRDAAFWGRRVRIFASGEARWLSIPLAKPVERGRIGVPIREMLISDSDPQTMGKCLASVRAAYQSAAHFAEFFPLVEQYFTDSDPNLMKRNMRFIESVLTLLGIRTRLVYSSSLGISTRSTQLLVDLLRAVGASTYRCGGGAGGYQQDELFSAAGITLEYNSYQQIPYPQPLAPQFVPGLSIIDALFNAGSDMVRGWMRPG
jgi:hypothetical protein